jgi:hypothetical protein
VVSASAETVKVTVPRWDMTSPGVYSAKRLDSLCQIVAVIVVWAVVWVVKALIGISKGAVRVVLTCKPYRTSDVVSRHGQRIASGRLSTRNGFGAVPGWCTRRENTVPPPDQNTSTVDRRGTIRCGRVPLCTNSA